MGIEDPSFVDGEHSRSDHRRNEETERAQNECDAHNRELHVSVIKRRMNCRKARKLETRDRERSSKDKHFGSVLLKLPVVAVSELALDTLIPDRESTVLC